MNRPLTAAATRDQAAQHVAIPPDAPSGVSERAQQRLDEIDIDDSRSLLFFGSAAQESLTEISDRMLEQVRTKDLGPAGEALNDMVLTLRGFDSAAAVERRPVGWFGKILGRTRGTAKLLQRYEAARDQIEAIGTSLQGHQNDLLFDIEALDRLYRSNLSYVHELEGYIEAGDAKLAEIEHRLVPDIQNDKTQDATRLAQRLRDLRASRDHLERRVHDLRLTRQVALQALPSIRLVQDNDKLLVAQIDSTLANTVPLWRQQLAQTLTIQRASEAADTIAAAKDLTNQLLRSNAEQLKAANRKTREQAERGVFDISAISEANQALIETVEDSLRIAKEGREMRAKAVERLRDMENELRRALRAA